MYVHSQIHMLVLYIEVFGKKLNTPHLTIIVSVSVPGYNSPDTRAALRLWGKQVTQQTHHTIIYIHRHTFIVYDKNLIRLKYLAHIPLQWDYSNECLSLLHASQSLHQLKHLEKVFSSMECFCLIVDASQAVAKFFREGVWQKLKAFPSICPTDRKLRILRFLPYKNSKLQSFPDKERSEHLCK